MILGVFFFFGKGGVVIKAVCFSEKRDAFYSFYLKLEEIIAKQFQKLF